MQKGLKKSETDFPESKLHGEVTGGTYVKTPVHALPVVLYGFAYRLFVRAVHYWLPTPSGTCFQSFDPFGLEAFHPGID